jgi:hypothetical protein
MDRSILELMTNRRRIAPTSLFPESSFWKTRRTTQASQPDARLFDSHCVFLTLERNAIWWLMISVNLLGNPLNSGAPMKKIFVALVATVVAVGMAGCVGVGKGKAPPVVTKG